MSAPLVCLGNPLLDFQVDVAPEYLTKYSLKANDAILAEPSHLPIFDETSAMEGVKFVAGGAAQNTARGAQYVLPPNSVVYFGSVGKDHFAEKLLAENKKAGVRTEYMVQETIATGKCAALITGHDRSLVTDLAAANHFKPSHLEKPENWALVEAASHFYIGGFHLTVSPDAIELLGKHAAEQNKTFVMNLSAPFIPEFFKAAVDQVMPYVDIVVANESEAAAYAKANGIESEDLATIAKHIVALPKAGSKTRTVIFTHGLEPTVVVSAEGVNTYAVKPLQSSKIEDTNGAGDAFAGGLMGGLVQGWTLEKSIDLGHWLAKESIQCVGPSYPEPKVSYA